MKNIALALSGGGFRAAAYALGSLSYLNTLKTGEDNHPLLENVKFIGSTSGGSMANIFYSSGVFKGDDFRITYKALLAAMDGEVLIARVFKILKAKEPWKDRDSKSKNLINAFSIAYNELFGCSTFKELYTPKTNVVPHLEEVCLNSTEFTNGISFRFQSQRLGVRNGLIGNNYIYFTNMDTAGDILLGDIMACSSCFSGGFEPFIFPDDFAYKNFSREKLKAGIVYESNPFTVTDPSSELLSNEHFKEIKERFGLMDGGVDDNQAIDSIFKARDRRKDTGNSFDLVLLTDVDGYFVDGYTLPMEKKRWYNAFTMQQIINSLKISGIAFAAIIAYVIIENWKEWMKFAFILLGILAICYVGGLIYLTIQKKQAFKSKSTWLVILFKYINYFLTIRVSRLGQMISSRLKSVFLLADDLYLKQIRRMYYNMIYADKELGPITVSNAIYALSEAKLTSKKDARLAKTINAPVEAVNAVPPIETPSPLIRKTAEQARSMPTTLWFDQFHQEADMLRTITATGQFTTCYTLLKYYLKKAVLTPEEATLIVQLKRDWEEFNKNPFVLYDRLV